MPKIRNLTIKQPVVPPFSVIWVQPGELYLDAVPGDIILVRYVGKNIPTRIASWLIREGMWIRKKTRPYAWCEHAMTVVYDGGLKTQVVQDTPRGAVLSYLNKQSDTVLGFSEYLYCVIHPIVPYYMKEEAVKFALWALGTKYGWFSIISDGLEDITGLHVALSTYGRMVCSALACRALERMGLIPDREPDAVQPGNLASYFNITTVSAKEFLV